MPYCPKCGGTVDETMVFCPKCGAALKLSTPNQTELTNGEQEKQKNPAETNRRIHQKNRYGSVNYLIGGLILITLAVFGILFLTDRFLATGQSIATALVIIGIIIISGAVYVHYPDGKILSETKQPP